jgi:hypothetical protein
MKRSTEKLPTVKSMNKSLRLLLLVLPLFLFNACSKKTIAPKPVIKSTTLALEEVDFEYLHGKARMVVRNDNKEQEFKANIRVRKDSVIWMNFTVIGVQGGRALINHDSITILNNVKNEYFVFDFKELSRKLNFEVNYKMIQAAMLGNLIMERSESDSVEEKSATYLLKQTQQHVDILNFISAATMKIQKVELKENDSHNSVTINYGNFQALENKTFPYDGTINVFYKTATGLLNTTIIFEYTKAEVGDKELKFPFNVPKKYERR